MKILAVILLLGGALGTPIEPDSYEPRVVFRHDDKVVNENTQEEGHPSRSFQLQLGTTAGSLHYLNDEIPYGRAIIFLDSVAGVEGKISSWQFFTTGACRFCLAVFHRKKTADGLQYFVEFAGENCFEVYDEYPVLTDYEIPMGYKLSVNSNSMVGVIYDEKDSIRCLRMESNQEARMKPELTLGRIMVLNPEDLQYGQQDYFIRPGTIVKEEILKGPDGITNFLGTPSFKAIVTGATNTLELAYGPHLNEGYALIYLNQQWGTICDLWYHTLGWAQLFCDENDLPAIDDVHYSTQPIPDDTPINLMNPRCKLSQNQTMFQCHSREDQQCTHDDDLYIVCKRGVKLEGGLEPGEGICYRYESNYWGSICDKTSEQITGKNHWAHVCCRELGYKKAKKMTYAKNVIPITDKILKTGISMHSPVCGSDGGPEIESLKGCKDGSIGDHCGHEQDMYVYCS
jgi:hypothetical protein